MVCTYIVRYGLALHMCNFPVIFVFSTVDLTKNAQNYSEICSLSLPVHMVATVVKAICKYCGRLFGQDMNL
jgi:hypothetical protein